MHEKKNVIAYVPTQDKPVGLHMLTLMDINTYNKKHCEHGNTQTDVGGGMSTKMYFLLVLQSISTDCRMIFIEKFYVRCFSDRSLFKAVLKS